MGADPSACDNDGLQPLHVAASGGHVRCCEVLLAAGAKPSAPDVHGISPQIYALTATGDNADAVRRVLGVSDCDVEEMCERLMSNCCQSLHEPAVDPEQSNTERLP